MTSTHTARLIQLPALVHAIEGISGMKSTEHIALLELSRHSRFVLQQM
jgi:hypothetical protein